MGATVNKSENYAHCKVCSSDINISAGVTQLEAHQGRAKHIDKAKESKTQSTFNLQNGSINLTTSTSTRQLSTENQILHAEIVRCLDSVDSNLPFSVADSDAEKYAKMFPCCREVKDYHQKSNKVKYMIQFGIAPSLIEVILAELRDLPFTFRFDETTTSQIKKQYDGYATYDSPFFGRIITTYIGTLFVGKCTADDLLKYTNEMMERLKLETESILSLGMDGPNVNLSFKRKLESELVKKNTKIIDVGSCPLHIAANGFLEVLKSLQSEAGIDLDQIVLDLYGFFKYSAKRIKDYLSVKEFTDLQGRRMLKHVSTRWVSIQDVLIRILEQLPNLVKYFLTDLPKEPGFNNKSGVGNQERYIRIKKALLNKKLPAVAYSVIFVAKSFNDFLVKLQAVRPMIVVLYEKMLKLIKQCMTKFLLDERFSTSDGVLKSLKTLKSLKLTDDKIQKVSICYVELSIKTFLI